MPNFVLRAVAALGGVFAVFAFALPASASAAWVTNCRPDPGAISGTITNDAAIEVHDLHRSEAQNCLAITERLERLAAVTAEGLDSTAPTEVSGRVALAPDDRNRLDLIWWGAWAALGLGFLNLLLPSLNRAFPWGRSGL